MKKALIVLGFVFLLLIVLIGADIAYMAITGPQLDASSKAYVDANIPVIVSAWSERELEKRASKELKGDLTGQNWNHFTSKVKQLGTFQEYEGCKGQSYTTLTLQHGKVVTAYYTVSADFQKGPAEIVVSLVQRRGKWQIAELTVHSPILAE